MIPYRVAAELLLGAAVGAAATFGYVLYVARQVGPVEYSDFSASLSIIYFVGQTLTPLVPTIARAVARARARGEVDVELPLRAAMMRGVVIGVGSLSAIGACGAFWAAQSLHFRTPWPPILAFAAIFLFCIVSVDRGILQGQLRFRPYNLNVIGESVVRLLAAGLLLLLVRNASLALVAYIVALAVSEIFMAVPLARHAAPRRRTETFDWSQVQRLAGPIVLLMFAFAIFQNTDMLAVKRWFTPEDAGAYGAAMIVARVVGVICVPFYILAGPLLTSLQESGRPLFPVTGVLTLLFCGTALAALIPVAWAPRWILASLYGLEFVRAAPILAPLGGTAVITGSGLLLAQALITVHDRRFLGPLLVLALGQVVALCLLHDSFKAVLHVLYAFQGAALLSILCFFVLGWWNQNRKALMSTPAGR